MSSRPDETIRTQRLRRPQPLWPWLVMPLAVLAIFLGLRNVREAQLRALAAPDTAAEATAPGTGDRTETQR
jgi:hypothetical protein